MSRPPDNTTSPSSLVRAKKILICVGSGGVGKTTTAAALGLLAAQARRKTLVLTIDPARRLAAALGLAALDHHQREVPADKQAVADLLPGHFLAMMLDPKRTFDEMVRRYAPNQETLTRLLQSKLYHQISSRLAGSQEYAAMETLYEIWRKDEHELLVLDTPPTANALDFLDAPGKLVDAVESPAVSLFIRVYDETGRMSLKLLGFGASYVMKRLARFVGGDFLDDIARYLSELSSLLGGMKERATHVQEMLTSEEVGFIIVTGPDPRAIDEAIALHRRLHASGMSAVGFIINKVHPRHDNDLDQEEIARLIKSSVDLSNLQAEDLSSVVLRSHDQMQSLACSDEEEIQRLHEAAGPDTVYLEVPFFDQDIFDMEGLIRLGEHLR